jgi:monoamine oxidase
MKSFCLDSRCCVPAGAAAHTGPPNAHKDSYRVVVVGAGVAGLSAAYQLKRKGIDDVVVVEAQGRTGGRVKQVALPFSDSGIS